MSIKLNNRNCKMMDVMNCGRNKIEVINNERDALKTTPDAENLLLVENSLVFEKYELVG